jgi:hypothetical protein
MGHRDRQKKSKKSKRRHRNVPAGQKLFRGLIRRKSIWELEKTRGIKRKRERKKEGFMI